MVTTTTPADVALQRQIQAPEPEAGAAPNKVVTAIWVLGLFTASVAITLAVHEPLLPVPSIHKNAYLLALSVAYFAGVAGVMAAVRIGWPTPPAVGRRATGRKQLVYCAAAVVAIGGLIVVLVVSVSLLSGY